MGVEFLVLVDMSVLDLLLLLLMVEHHLLVVHVELLLFELSYSILGHLSLYTHKARV